MGKLTEYITAAGLSFMLLAGEASGQQAKPLDLKTIEADKVVVQLNGRLVFNTASMPTNTTSTTAAPAATASSDKPAKAAAIGNVEDCLTASSNYVKTASAAAPAATTTTRERSGTVAQKPTRDSRATSSTGTVSQAFISTCYKGSKPVAKITFSEGKDPVVELITDSPTIMRR